MTFHRARPTPTRQASFPYKTTHHNLPHKLASKRTKAKSGQGQESSSSGMDKILPPYSSSSGSYHYSSKVVFHRRDDTSIPLSWQLSNSPSSFTAAALFKPNKSSWQHPQHRRSTKNSKINWSTMSSDVKTRAKSPWRRSPC